MIQIFNNSNFGELRTLNEDGNVLFCASDAAKILGYANPIKSVADHCRYITKRYIPHPQSADKTIEMNFIPESDLYRLIVHSQLEGAQKFEAWVFEECCRPFARQAHTLLLRSLASMKTLCLLRKLF